MTLVMIEEDAVRVVPRVPEGQANLEQPLRDLVYAHPGILPTAELEPGIGRIAAVATELSLPGAGFADVVLVSEHGRLIIVECKLWRNPQARREVVMQVLDYARELARYDYEALQGAVNNRLGRRDGNVLFELACQAGSTMSEAAFVDRVGRDLRAGRFLLLIVGDGITEGTQRLTEYLNGPGLAFDFGLIEMADYRFADPETGAERRIMQPRVIARTATIERLVIRSEVPGIVVDAVETDAGPSRRRDSGGGAERAGGGVNSEAYASWRAFVATFAAEARFDDPGQLGARFGGLNWMRVPLPGPAPLVLYRSGQSRIGAFLKYRDAEGFAVYDALEADRDAIAAEFASDGLEAPVWNSDGDERTITLIVPSPAPWEEPREEEQRRWMERAANRFVNSFRPRLSRMAG